MIPGMNPRQMKQMMRRMGMEQAQIDASEVIIKTSDKVLRFEAPEVSKVNVMGQETYQIVGTPIEESVDASPDINEDDIATVMDQTNVDEETARKAIEDNNGDLASAIMQLKGDSEE
ncbi:MAG: nascent polypeptide-associated complex protein [Candidatus Woesearchaeota archaeon]